MKILRHLAAAALLAGAAAADTLDVVATIPDLADVVSRVGGERVEVTSIAKGTENVHSVVVKPSHLVAVNRADLFVQVGLALEHSFVPGLLEKGRNQRILPGAPGFVNVSDGWEAIDVPATADRGQAADVHLFGNPHMNLDPRAGRHMAQRVLEGLLRVDPDGAVGYRARHAAYVEELEAAEARWAERAKAFRGRKVAVYHPDFAYFARHYDLIVAATIEPKPGLPPKPRDLARTIETLKEEGVDLILTARWSNNKDVRFVAQKAGARVLEVPILVHGVKGADTWIAMMDVLHDELARAFGGEVPEEG